MQAYLHGTYRARRKTEQEGTSPNHVRAIFSGSVLRTLASDLKSETLVCMWINTSSSTPHFLEFHET